MELESNLDNLLMLVGDMVSNLDRMNLMDKDCKTGKHYNLDRANNFLRDKGKDCNFLLGKDNPKIYISRDIAYNNLEDL